MNLDGPTQPSTYFNTGSQPHHHAAPAQSPFQTSQPVFCMGSVGSSGAQSLHVRVRAGEASAREIWVTLPWAQVMKEVLSHEAVLLNVMKELAAPHRQEARVKALRILADPRSSSGMSMSSTDPRTGQPLSFAHMPGSAHNPNFKLDSPLFSTIPDDLTLWTGGHRSSMDSYTSDGIPDTPMTPEFHDQLNFSKTRSPSDGEHPAVYKDGMRCFTADNDTIDPNLLKTRETNAKTEEFLWSPTDCALYGMDSLRAPSVLKEPDAVKLCFPPGTMMIAKEKDGMVASPAYTLTHPHSNEWLKAQVCHKQCAYRAGTTSLKRPKTVREHFQKCVWLDQQHPLKVLSSLQLAVLERESQGLLPRQRRGRIGIPPGRSQPYQMGRPGMSPSTNTSTPSTSFDGFKPPLNYSSSSESEGMAPWHIYSGPGRFIQSSPSNSSLSGLSSFETSPHMK